MALAPGDPRHGTITAYSYHRCRCEPCREANRRHQRTMRANNSQPSMKVNSYAMNKAGNWVRKNHPDVWRRFHAQGVVLFGVGLSGPKRKAS